MAEPEPAIPHSNPATLLAILTAHLAVALVFFWPFLFGGKAFFAVHNASYPPWREATDPARVAALDHERNQQMTDDLFMFHPEVLLSVRALENGELPTWNPYAFGGYPHIATGIPAFYYPLMALHLIMDPLRAYGCVAALQAVLAAFLMSAFLLRIGLHPLASALGGCLFAYSGWMTAHMLYYQITGASAWLGAMLLGMHAFVCDGRRLGAAAVALATGCSFAAGFPQTAFFNVYVTLAYGAMVSVQGARRPRRARDFVRSAWRLAWPVALGGLLAAAQLLPSAWLTVTGSSNRPIPSLEVLREFRLAPPALLTFLLPNLFGHPHVDVQLTSAGLYGHQLLAHLHLLTEHHGRAEIQGYTEIQGYVGIVPLVLALVGARSRLRRLQWFALIMLAVSLLAAVSTPIVQVLALLPGIRVGDLKRFLLPAGVAITWLAALGLDHLLRESRARGRVAIVIAAIGAIGFLAGAAWLHLGRSAFPEALARHVASATPGTSTAAVRDAVTAADFEVQRWTLLTSCGRASGLFLLVAPMLFLLARTRSRWPAVVVVVVATFDLVSFGRDLDLPRWLSPGFIRPLDPEGFLAPHPLITAMQSAAGAEPFRVMRYAPSFADEWVFGPKTLQPYGIEDAQGYAALYLDRYQKLIEAIPGTATEACTAVRGLQSTAALRSPALGLLNVRFVIARTEIHEPGFTLLAERDGVRIYDHRGVWPRAFLAPEAEVLPDRAAVLARITRGELAPGHLLLEREPAVHPRREETAQLVERVVWRARGLQHLELDVTTRGGFLVVTDCFDPSWRARVDGEPAPIEPAYGAFRAVALAPGAHRVQFQHAAHAERAGLAVSLAAILLVIAVGTADILGARRVARGRAHGGDGN